MNCTLWDMVIFRSVRLLPVNSPNEYKNALTPLCFAKKPFQPDGNGGLIADGRILRVCSWTCYLSNDNFKNNNKILSQRDRASLLRRNRAQLELHYLQLVYMLPL